MIGEDENQSETEKAELERIKTMSFNPLGLSLISNTDREYMWTCVGSSSTARTCCRLSS